MTFRDCPDDSKRTHSAARSRPEAGVVANGYSNLDAGVYDQARRIVEAKYADEFKAASLARRWKLRRTMKAEVKELAFNMMPDVSPDALF